MDAGAEPQRWDRHDDNSLTAIAGTQDTGLWAVGWRESPSGLQPLILRYDTTQPSPTWASVTGAVGFPTPPGTVDTVLTGVDVLSADDVWAVGYYFDGGVNQPLALHWDGSTWSYSQVPGAGMLRKVRALAPDNVWAAGTVYDGTLQRYLSLVEHFDGTSWTPVTSANAPAADTEIIGLATRSGGLEHDPGGPAGLQGGRRAGELPVGPPLARSRDTGARASGARHPGRRPRAEPAAEHAPGDDPDPGDHHRPGVRGGHRRHAGLDIQRVRCRFQRGWLAGHIYRAPLASGQPVAQQSGRHVQPVRYPVLLVRSRTGTTAWPPISAKTACRTCSAAWEPIAARRRRPMRCTCSSADGTFVDQAYQENVTDPWGRGRYGAVLDANNDGYPDIFYGTESLRPDGMPSIDRFYINTGQGSFVDDPAMGLDMNIGSLCAHTVDYNSDGWPDLLVCGETGGLHLFQNDQGNGFSDVSSILGTPIKAVDAAMVDVNHDNLPRSHHAHRERARRTSPELRTGPSASRRSSSQGDQERQVTRDRRCQRGQQPGHLRRLRQDREPERAGLSAGLECDRRLPSPR